MFTSKKTIDEILTVDAELNRKLSFLTDFTKKVSGDTDLHKVIRKFVYPFGFNEIKSLFAKLGKEEFSKQARTVNTEGDLPIDLITQYSKETQKILFKWLLPFCLMNTMKPISDLIDENEILRNVEVKDSKIVDRLKILCKAANKTRQLMSISITHPQINFFSKSDFYFFYSKYKLMKTKFNELKSLLWCSKDKETAEKRLSELVDYVKKNHGLGNCEYFAYVGLYFLKILNISTSLEVFYIPQLKNGRHWLLVVGRDINTDPVNFDSWNKDTIICDFWSGEIYLISMLKLKLKGFALLMDGNQPKSCVVEFNPEYHTLAIEFNMPINLFNDQLYESKQKNINHPKKRKSA